jgi:hypothetical protein
LVDPYVSGEVSRDHFQSLKADYEEVKLSKLEALKALEEDARARRVVLGEALLILGDLPALWASPDDNGKQAWVQAFSTTPSTTSSNSRRGVRIVFG